jgi:hypothetical protein
MNGMKVKSGENMKWRHQHGVISSGGTAVGGVKVMKIASWRKQPKLIMAIMAISQYQ